MKTLGYVVILMFAFAAPGQATQVYSGCSVPSSTARHVWYVDPVHGKSLAAGGNGSQASPWNSLNAIISGQWGVTGFSVPGYTRPLLSSIPYVHGLGGKSPLVADQASSPPVQPGDAIMLMSGNYGDVVIGNFGLETANSDFVTIEGASGQTPVFTTLTINATNKWVFNSVKVQSLMNASNTGPLISVMDQGASFPTTDIILENLQISSADSTAGWSQAQWVAQARNGYDDLGTPGNGANGEPYTTCVTMAGSHIQNVRYAVVLTGNNSLFSNNVIDHFGDDGIDYGANNLSITHNTIHDNLDIGDGNHEDAMQGVIGLLSPGVAFNAFSNILIDSNLIIRQTDPQLAFPTYLMGIDAFDEDWTNVTITNNVIVTSACQGIAFSSIHNSLIADNTVVEDGLFPTPGCVASIGVGGATHEGSLSTNTVVRNNLSSQLSVDTRDSGVSADHNVAMCCAGPEISWYVNGVVQFLGAPGTYANGNIIDTGGAKAEFLNFNPATLTYTVMLKSGSQAIGAGTAVGAPSIDIAGYARATPSPVGAYAYPF
jgi:hypothetical protein